MRKLPYLQTSVFVDDIYSFGGNQLATYWDYKTVDTLSNEDMQQMALEMNFSESTFLQESTRTDCDFKVRIFTPARELPFAGHPTLGSSFVAKKKGIVSSETTQATLEMQVGPISVTYEKDQIRMKQNPAEFQQDFNPDGFSQLADALSLQPKDLLDSYPFEWVSTGVPYLIVPLRSLNAVRKATPNLADLSKTIGNMGNQMILIFCTETIHPENQVHVRMFAPEVGIVEDPATGSAAGPLAAYLSKHELIEESDASIRIEQGYEIRRPSLLIAKVIENAGQRGVYVSGKTRLVAEGTFFLPE